MEDAATICAYIGAAFSFITYICVVYSTFKLKTDEKRQKYVATAVCIVNLMPPVISLLYDHHLKWWEITVNACCIIVYTINIVMEVLDKIIFYRMIVFAAVIVEILVSYRALGPMKEKERRVWYCAILSCGTVVIPALGCFIFTWRMSYMDTYVALLATTATLLQSISLVPDTTDNTRAIIQVTIVIGYLYSFIAFYRKHKFDKTSGASQEICELPDHRSTDAQYGSDTEKDHRDALGSTSSNKTGTRRRSKSTDFDSSFFEGKK